MYSKYDNVVAKYLPIYYAYHKKNKIKIDENRYIILESKRAQLKKQGIERLKIEYAKLYEKYNNDIQEIIDELKKANINLTRDEVDHIIWYTLKGNWKARKGKFSLAFQFKIFRFLTNLTGKFISYYQAIRKVI